MRVTFERLSKQVPSLVFVAILDCGNTLLYELRQMFLVLYHRNCCPFPISKFPTVSGPYHLDVLLSLHPLQHIPHNQLLTVLYQSGKAQMCP